MPPREEPLRLVALQMHKRTIDGRLDWEPTSIPNLFQCNFPDFVVQIEEQDRRTRTPDYELAIVQDNRIVDRLSATALGDDHLYQMMRDTFQAARRQAMDADEIVAKLLSELQEP